MPCKNPNHNHFWPSEGVVVVERCEKFCQFCRENGVEDHEFGSAWFLRRHIRDMHAKPDKDHPLITEVPTGWTGSITGNAKPHSKESTFTKRRERKNSYRAKSKTASPEPATGVSPPLTQAALNSMNAAQPSYPAHYLPEHQQLLNALTQAIAAQAPQVTQQQHQSSSATPQATASVTQAVPQGLSDDVLALLFPEETVASQSSSEDTFVTAPTNPAVNNVNSADVNTNDQLPSEAAGIALYGLYDDLFGGQLELDSDADNVALENGNNNSNTGIRLAFSVDESDHESDHASVSLASNAGFESFTTIPTDGYINPADLASNGATNYAGISLAFSDVSSVAASDNNSTLESLTSSDSSDSTSTFASETSVYPASTTTEGSTTPNPNASNTCIDPSILSDADANALYKYVCGWSTPQTIRTNNVVLEAKKPFDHLDGSPDRLVRRLNQVFRELRADTVMSDEQILGVGESWLLAFRYGRAF